MIRNEKTSITNYFQDATAKRLDQYWVSVDDIEKMTGENVPVADYAKHDMLDNIALKIKGTVMNKLKILTGAFLVTSLMIGSNAWAVSTGTLNTYYGIGALYSNTTGSRNTAFGDSAIYSNTTGSRNTATGQAALYSNTTGSYNTANGLGALDLNTTGSYNTANGTSALKSSTTGANNVADGYFALSKNTTGGSNVGIGANALLTNTTGSNNTAVGINADVSAAALTNATAIGYGAKVGASNKVRIGNTSVTKIEGQVALTTTSDKRLKNHITDLPLGLDFITQLRPVEYLRNNDAEKSKEWGLIAQELQQTLKTLGYKDAGIVTEDSSPEKYMTVRYNDLLAPMIKATQEQQKLIQAQDGVIKEQEKTNQQQGAVIEEQAKIISDLLKRVEALETK